MSSSQEIVTHQLLNVAAAANADQLADAQPKVTATETATGWDAYEVWRRFIKEARDRRESTHRNDARPK
jgi:hypothetical protein